MSFETISLLLSWMEMGALLAILFRLSSTFELIASTQRELRRAIHRLAERRGNIGMGDEMAKKITRSRPWTEEDVRTLKMLASGKTKTVVIAWKLKRSADATRQKASVLGVTLGASRKKRA